MIPTQFYDDLTRSMYEDRLDPFRRDDGVLRLIHHADGLTYCPITAVFNRRTGRYIDLADSYVAAAAVETCTAVGLTPHQARAVIDAADNMAGCDPEIRAALFRAMGDNVPSEEELGV